MAFNIAPFIAYNLTKPKNRKEEKTMEAIIRCPKCGANLCTLTPIIEICDNKVTVTIEYLCCECDESFFTKQTGMIDWD